MKTFSIRYFLANVVFSTLWLPTALQAQTCGTIQNLQVTPEIPRERETFTIGASGEWCVNVMSKQSTVSVADNTITFTVTVQGGLLQIIDNWNASATLENLRHGKYTVIVRLRDALGRQVAESSYPLDIKGGKGKP